MTIRIMMTSALLAVLGAPASGQAPLADRVPSETLLYLGWAGRSLAFDGSVMGQLLAEPSVGDLLGAIRQVVAEKLPPDRPAKMFHHGWSLAGMAWQHPVAIALVDLRHPGSGQAPAVGAVLIELGSNSQDFQKHLDGILGLLGVQRRLRLGEIARGDGGADCPDNLGPLGGGRGLERDDHEENEEPAHGVLPIDSLRERPDSKLKP